MMDTLYHSKGLPTSLGRHCNLECKNVEDDTIILLQFCGPLSEGMRWLMLWERERERENSMSFPIYVNDVPCMMDTLHQSKGLPTSLSRHCNLEYKNVEDDTIILLRFCGPLSGVYALTGVTKEREFHVIYNIRKWCSLYGGHLAWAWWGKNQSHPCQCSWHMHGLLGMGWGKGNHEWRQQLGE